MNELYPVIRVAASDDREGIIRLITAIAAERKHLQTDCYCSTPTWERVLAEGLNLNAALLLLVVVVDQQIIGFGRLTADEDYAMGNIGLGLLPPYRGRGIGSQLLSQLIAWVPVLGFRQLNAAILAWNVHSRSLFRKFGFAEVQCRIVGVPYTEGSVEEVIVQLDVTDRREVSCPQPCRS